MINSISANTKLYCIFGKPARHSLSPQMHNAAFQECGIDAVYLAFEPEDFSSAIDAVRTLPIQGASITIPFKIDVLPLCDTVDPLAREIGSVNTLYTIGGKITGFNTDGYGSLLALKRSGIHPENSSVLILGNGGSARAVAFTLFQSNTRITIAGRNINKIKKLSNDISTNPEKCDYILLEELNDKLLSEIDIIINTTSVGMAPDDDMIPINPLLIKSTHTVMDIIYKPSKTRLLQESEKKGCATIGGIEMLLYQGVKQFEIWTGLEAPVEIMRKALGDNIKD